MRGLARRASRERAMFFEHELRDLLAENDRRLRAEVEAQSLDRLAGPIGEDYRADLLRRFSIGEVQIHRDRAYSTRREAQIPAEQFPPFFNVRPGKRYPKQVLSVHVPFTGNGRLLLCRGSTWTTAIAHALVHDDEIELERVSFRDVADVEDIDREIKRALDNIASQLEVVLADVRAYNARLEDEARRLIDARRQKPNAWAQAESKLSFPVRRTPPAVPNSSPVRPPDVPRAATPAPTTPAETSPSELASAFISYGGPDEGFAARLEEALRSRGVATFLFKRHARWGEKLHREMRNGVNRHDRVILVCSQASLGRAGVLNEIEEVLAREAREGGVSILIPIALDEHVFSDWAPDRPDLAQAIRDRVIGDFRGGVADAEEFTRLVDSLVATLRRDVSP